MDREAFEQWAQGGCCCGHCRADACDHDCNCTDDCDCPTCNCGINARA
ncbi:MAG: hypothetical protein K6U87_11600 [Firmicutes bacterium]|nr:hypothetical protein [Bacillota bacterium]